MFTFKLLSFATTMVCLASFAAAATTVMPCSRRSDLIKLLGKEYKEVLSGFGVSGQQNIVEFFISKAGTFTILATRSDGISCVIATGDNWENELKNLTSL
jgi:hypothetical protein